MSGHSVSQNMKNAIRKLSAMRPRKCITVGRTLLRLSEPLDGLDQLLDLGLIPLAHGGRHTALDVVLEEEKPHLVNRGLDGIDLGQNVDAVRFLIDHPRDAADLPFDPPQTGKEGVAILYVAWLHDSLKIYPRRVSPLSGRLSGCDALDDPPFEPLEVLDVEAQRPHVPEWVAHEMVTLGSDGEPIQELLDGSNKPARAGNMLHQ